MEEAIDDMGFDRFDDILQYGNYNALKSYARVISETDSKDEAEAEAGKFFERYREDVFIYDQEENEIYN